MITKEQKKGFKLGLRDKKYLRNSLDNMNLQIYNTIRRYEEMGFYHKALLKLRTILLEIDTVIKEIEIDIKKLESQE